MNNESSAKLTTLAVIAVVVFQFLIAALRLILFARGVRIEIAEHSVEYTHPPDLWYAFGGLLATIVVCAVTAAGLLMRRIWACQYRLSRRPRSLNNSLRTEFARISLDENIFRVALNSMFSAEWFTSSKVAEEFKSSGDRSPANRFDGM